MDSLIKRFEESSVSQKGLFMLTKAKGCVELHTDSRESATPLQDINELRTLLQAKSEALIEDLA
jgi:hypothetical protein